MIAKPTLRALPRLHCFRLRFTDRFVAPFVGRRHRSIGVLARRKCRA
jgi:hypothetical protein